ncbi:MAG: PIN domain-containing protein [Pseudomonadota bacterium]
MNRINYIFIDFENVQPPDIDLIQKNSFIVKIFVGANQTKIPIKIATAIQKLGDKAEYILLDSSGHNALDFHISYYIGSLVEIDPKGYFHIISKDSGFDPLIAHLKKKKISISRCVCIKEIPLLRPIPDSFEKQIDAVIARLRASKPRTQATLINTINSLFRKEISEANVEMIFKHLCKLGIVKIEGTKISYSLPE